jgi:anti-anti-sigma factor
MIDMPGLLQLQIFRTDCAVQISLHGELDIYSSKDLESTLRDIEPDTDLILLDLSNLDFMDCAGLRTIVEANSRARRRGANLRLVKGPQRVQRVFVLTQLDQHLEFVEPRTDFLPVARTF